MAYEQDSDERSANVAMTTTTTTTTESVEEVVRGETPGRLPFAGSCRAHWLLLFCCLCCCLMFDHQNSSPAFFLLSFFCLFVCLFNLLFGLPVVRPVPAVCWAPAESGPCHDMLERWYFMPEKRRCAPFLFGGCGGNRNNFESEEYCLAVCSSSCKFQEAHRTRPEVAGLPVRLPSVSGCCRSSLSLSPLCLPSVSNVLLTTQSSGKQTQFLVFLSCLDHFIYLKKHLKKNAGLK